MQTHAPPVKREPRRLIASGHLHYRYPTLLGALHRYPAVRAQIADALAGAAETEAMDSPTAAVFRAVAADLTADLRRA